MIVCVFSYTTYYFAWFLSSVFCDSNGNILKENDTITFSKLADTYEHIAENGAEGFYSGQLAENLVRDIQGAGSVLFFHKNVKTNQMQKRCYMFLKSYLF